MAFGGLVRVSPDNFSAYTRSGTTHLANGKIVKIELDATTLAPTSPLDVLTDGTYDLRSASTGIIDGDIGIFTARYTHTTGPWIDLKRYISTDGTTGETFDSGTTMTNTLEKFNFYGKLIEGEGAGEYLICEYEVNTANTVYTLYLWRRNSGGTWSRVTVWTGDNTAGYVEPALCRVADNTYFIIARSDVLNGLHLFISTDGGSTWSAPSDMAVGGADCMADMALDPTGKLTLCYCDRAINRMVISSGNVIADIISDPTDWTNFSELFESYTTDSLGILGYPTIVYDGFKVCITVSAEFSSTRADLYWGYGVLGFGV